jgi:hypothetical protein
LLDHAETVYADYHGHREYAQAVAVSQLAIAATSRTKDVALQQKWLRSHIQSEAARKAFLAAERGLKVLEENPHDGEARTEVGRYLCFYEGDWENGVSILAKGHDRSLKRIAELELLAPEDPNEQLKIADLWWQESERAQAAEVDAMQKRAAHWYADALPGLPPGLVRLRAERRLEELGADEVTASSI